MHRAGEIRVLQAQSPTPRLVCSSVTSQPWAAAMAAAPRRACAIRRITTALLTTLLTALVRGDDTAAVHGPGMDAAWLAAHRSTGAPLTVMRMHRRALNDYPNANATRARSLLAAATLDVMGSVQETGCAALGRAFTSHR
jgi:hypothetical protein